MEKTVLERLSSNIKNYRILFKLLGYDFDFIEGEIHIASPTGDNIVFRESKETLNSEKYTKVVSINREAITISFLNNGEVNISVDGSTRGIAINTNDKLSSWAMAYRIRIDEFFSKEYSLSATPEEFSIREVTMCYRNSQAIHNMGLKYVVPTSPNNIAKDHTQVYNNYLTDEGMLYGMTRINERNNGFNLVTSRYKGIDSLDTEPNLLIPPKDLMAYEYYLVNSPQAIEIITSVIGVLEGVFINLEPVLKQSECLCSNSDNRILVLDISDSNIQETVQRYINDGIGETPTRPSLVKNICQPN